MRDRAIPLVLLALAVVLFMVQLISRDHMDTSLQVRGGERNLSSKVVAIYAGRSFHDEVAGSMACMYHQLGYEVVVYVESGFRLGSFIVPFTHVRLQESQAFYGRCVHKWIPITTHMRLVPNVNVLVMITYPMKIAHHTLDPDAFSLLRQVRDTGNNTKLLLVTHHAKDRFWRHLPDIVRHIEPNRITFLFLAEHVYKHAQRLVANSTEFASRTIEGNNIVGDMALSLGRLPQLAYIYPLLRRELLFDKNRTGEFNSLRREAALGGSPSPSLSFAIQGHFASEHSKRRDLEGTVRCLYSLLRNSSNAAEYSLRLIGKGDKQLPIPVQGNWESATVPVKVQRLADLAPVDFYSEIAKSNFLLTATGSESYTTVQATSTIPIALLLQIPLVMPAVLLGKYPCLRDSPTLRQLSGETNCDAIQRAVGMNVSHYAAVQAELRHCADTLWQDAISTLRTISV